MNRSLDDFWLNYTLFKDRLQFMTGRIHCFISDGLLVSIPVPSRSATQCQTATAGV